MSKLKLWDGHERVDKEPYIAVSMKRKAAFVPLREILEGYLDDFHNQCYGEHTEGVIDLLRNYADKIETSLYVYNCARTGGRRA